MEVSVEVLPGLERQITVVIPSEKVAAQVEHELRKLASRVQIDGFRRGKTPFTLIKQRYADSVRIDVAKDLLHETFPLALEKNNLSPVSSPEVAHFDVPEGKDFRYTMTFEVYPEVKFKAFDASTELEFTTVALTEADIDHAVEQLRARHKTWSKTKRASEKGDQLLLDFKGLIEDVPFAGGESKGFEIELGSGNMIPGFEDALMHHAPGESFSIEVTFPKDYHESTLAGKPATFEITLHEVREGVLPALDADFIKSVGMASGELQALREDLRIQMQRELDNKLRQLNQTHCFDKFTALNPVELPKGLIKKEIEHLKHELFHQIFGPQHSPNEKIPDFPDELFEERAKHRVHLGLLVSEYLKETRLVVDEALVEETINRLADAYVDAEEFKRKIRQNEQWMSNIESSVLERMMVDKLCETASIKTKNISYTQLMEKSRE